MRKLFLFCILFSVLLGGCFYDNYTELYPAAGSFNSCDTVSQVTYGKQVSAVMNNYCISCHSQGVANGNTVLDSYSAVVNAAMSGKLIGTMRHQSGYAAMPPNTQMDECSIREVEIWIQSNYPQ